MISLITKTMSQDAMYFSGGMFWLALFLFSTCWILIFVQLQLVATATQLMTAYVEMDTVEIIAQSVRPWEHV